MVILEVYSHCLKSKFKSRLCSKATLLVAILNVALIILPFVLAYKSKGFWLKHDTFFEQPDVRFTGEYLLIAKTNNISRPIICTNLPLNAEDTYLDNCTEIRVRELDHNFDGKMEGIEAKLTVDLQSDLQIISFDLLLMFQYKLHTYCSFVMQSAIMYQQYLPNGVNQFEVNGDLRLRQTGPLVCHTRWKNTQYDYPIIEDIADENMFNIKNIIDMYLLRNVTTHLTNIYTTYATTGGENLAISLRVSYPIQNVYYQPGFWQIMKHAWIQYFAIYTIIAFAVNKIKHYVFKNRLILFYKFSPLKDN